VIRRFLIAIAGLAAAVAGIALLLLPARALPAAQFEVPRTWPVVRGAYHIHSQRSDGTGTLDEIASAAARANLQFVIVTDHGDRAAPEAPSYRSGVLVIDAVEISTRDGHYVALGLGPTPFRLAGDARDVIEDVRRFGGFGFAAHPNSPKADLQWRAWEADFEGLEWLNADSEWRDEPWTSLAAALLTYPLRAPETLGALLDEPRDTLARWDELTRTRRVPVLAASDAHARLGGIEQSDPYQDRPLARIPSYEASFRTFANYVILASALSGDAATDASVVLSAIRDGHAFTAIDSLATLGGFEAKAVDGASVATPGAYLDVAAPVAIEAAIAAPAGTTMAVLRDGERLYEAQEAALRIDIGRRAGAYRIEARLPGQRAGSVPWLLTNPMYVGVREAHARAAAQASRQAATVRTPIATHQWAAESSEGSGSTLAAVQLEDGTPAIEWLFTLAPGPRGAQYAAMRFPITGGLSAHDRLQLRVRGSRPMRVWAQLRAPSGAGLERWGKSFYVDEDLNSVELQFRDFRPFESWSAAQPPLDHVDALLLVVDTVNTDPGSAGRLAITDLWFAR
jgi:hypothetical protein